MTGRRPVRSRGFQVIALAISHALARRARVHVERHFSLEAMVAETLDVYCALLGR